MLHPVREKFSCRSCETITQPPAPFHVAGPHLVAIILFEKFGQHQPLNRQSERYACGGIDLSVSTLADQSLSPRKRIGANIVRESFDSTCSGRFEQVAPQLCLIEGWRHRPRYDRSEQRLCRQTCQPPDRGRGYAAKRGETRAR